MDTERARTDSPFGTTVAHGNLTLSMIDGFRSGLMELSGFKWCQLRLERCAFPRRCPPGAASGPASRPCRSTSSTAADQIAQKWTVEVEGNEKPACVAESVGRLLA